VQRATRTTEESKVKRILETRQRDGLLLVLKNLLGERKEMNDDRAGGGAEARPKVGCEAGPRRSLSLAETRARTALGRYVTLHRPFASAVHTR